MEGKNSENEQRTFFFLVLVFTFWNYRNLFGVDQNGKFLPVKNIFHVGIKIGKSDFAPSEKYSFYATVSETQNTISS